MQSVGEKLTELSVEIHCLLPGACENIQNQCAIQRIITDIKAEGKSQGQRATGRMFEGVRCEGGD